MPLKRFVSECVDKDETIYSKGLLQLNGLTVKPKEPRDCEDAKDRRN